MIDTHKPVYDGTPKTGSHWRHVGVRGKPILAVDFHHVVTTRCSACPGNDLGDVHTNGPPQDGVREALLELCKDFFILIYTGSGNFWSPEKCKSIIDYLEDHKIPYDDVRFDKPPAIFIVDDRAIHHIGWTETLEEIKRRLSMTTPYEEVSP